jgi:uncharacterized protein (DUF2147 family)
MFRLRVAATAAVGMLAAAITPATAQPQTKASAQAQASPPTPPTNPIYGMWINPYRSVAVRTGPCGERLCGWIVWANQEAQDDAREGGTPKLIGTALLENYRNDKPGSWSGTVFVPDMNRRFYSIIQQVAPDQMKVKGCILGGLLCKSQIWHRIGELPHA